jgi:hypothetical protein
MPANFFAWASETRPYLQADAVHEEDKTKLLDEGSEGGFQIVAEVGKNEAGEQGSRDAQAEPRTRILPRASPEAATKERMMTL